MKQKKQRLNKQRAVSLLSGLVLALPGYAQQPAPEPPTFGEIIDVRVINLEVVVTDGKDRIQGLTADDFRILVDGEEVPLEYFTEVLGGQAVLPQAENSTTIPALAPGEAVGTRILVFIDDAFSVRTKRNRVLKRMIEQLPHLGPEDSMALVAYDGRQIELLTSWTRSQRELERVFEAAQERRAYGLQRRLANGVSFGGPFGSGLGSGFGNFAGSGPFRGDGFGSGFGSGTGPGSRTYADVDQVLGAATSVLRGFAKPSGRKVMLLLSGGWPTAGGTGFSSDIGYAGGGSRSLLRPLVDTANRLGYTLYPVDLKGAESHFSGAEFGPLGRARFAENFSRDREWIEESSLVYLAEETGGKALLDGASLTALQRTVEDTRSYYWLGFTPSWQEDDRRHRVKVEVRRKGLKARSRDSFSDLSRTTEVSMLLESAQLFDLPVPGLDKELQVSIGEPLSGGSRKVVIPLRVEVPLDEITLLPFEGGYGTRLELRVAVTDDRGNRADIPVMLFDLKRKEQVEPGDFTSLEVPLRIRRRPHRMLVSVHDPASGTILSQKVGVDL